MSNSPLIAIVDNDLSFLEMMGQLLGDEGYEPLVLDTNSDAFAIIRQRQPQLVIIELLIMDPDYSWLVLNKMRLDPQTAHIPVIISSTATDLLQRNEAHLRSKRCDILLKPFELEDLLVMVSKYATRS
jgi:CheY-like chemotaxis protein